MKRASTDNSLEELHSRGEERNGTVAGKVRSQMYERNNSTWHNDGNDPLGEETNDTRERIELSE